MHVFLVFIKNICRISLHYSPPEKNKMTSHFVPATDKRMFLLNEATVSPNTKKIRRFCLTVCIEVFFKLKVFVININDKMNKSE
jgi:hypothetical protein